MVGVGLGSLQVLEFFKREVLDCLLLLVFFFFFWVFVSVFVTVSLDLSLN